MNCKTSIDKTKDHMFEHGIINKFNDLSAEDGPTLSKFNSYVAYIKDLATSKFGELPEAYKKPIFLEGKKVVFNNGFFEWVDGKLAKSTEPNKDIIVKPVDNWKTWDFGNYEGKPESETKPIKFSYAKEHPFDVPEGSTESFNQFKDRVIDEYTNTLSSAPDNSIVVISSQSMKVLEAFDAAGSKGHDIDIDHYLKESTDNGEVIKKQGTNGAVYFVRHGETPDNTEGVERTKDVELNGKGKDTALDAAKELKRLLEGKEIGELRASSLPRTLETANIIAKELSKKDEKTSEEGYYQLNDNIHPLLKSSIEKSLAPDLHSLYLTPNTFEDKLSKFGYSKEESDYLTEPLRKNPSLWLEAPNVHNLISYRVEEQLKFDSTSSAKKANKELDNQLKSFLKGLNISVEEFNDLKSKLGINALGFANIIDKSILLAENRKITTLPEEAGHFYVELLTKRNTQDNLTEYNLYKDLMSKIESWDKFKEIKEKYLPIYKDIEKVKKEAIAKAISESIVNRFEGKNDELKGKLGEFLDWIKSIFKTNKNFDVRLLTDDIAKKILSKDYSDISKDLDSSAKLTDFKDIDKPTHELISSISKLGANLTGSTALRKQGTIYRTEGEQFHDLDFRVPFSNKEEFLSRIKETFPDIEKKSEFQSGKEGSQTTIWTLNHNGKEYSIDFFFDKSKYTPNPDGQVNWRDAFDAKLQMGRNKDVSDFVNFKPREIDNTPEKKPFKEPTDNKGENRKVVVDKMHTILDTLGIKSEVVDGIYKAQSQINTLKSTLKDANVEQRRQIEHEIKQLENQGIDKDTAALADITNQLILFSKDQLSDDNLTEETIHFVVDIVEQKDKDLFDKFMDKIRGYDIYSQTLKDYQEDPEYRKGGQPDYYKLKKEAIAKLITEKLINREDVISGDKGFFGAIWDKITNMVKKMFGELPSDLKDEFSAFSERLLDDYIKPDDSKLFGQSSEEQFKAKKRTNINQVLSKASKLYGAESEIPEHSSPKEARDFLVDKAKSIELIEEKDEKTGETTSYYKVGDGKKVRAHSILEEASGVDFKNLKGDEAAKARRELQKQKGTLIHKTIEDIVDRYVDSLTGGRRDIPLKAPENLDVTPEIYKVLHDNIVDRLNSYPKDTYFSKELRVVNEREGYAGTIDFMAFLPNGKVDILDWKTVGMYKYDNLGRSQISDVNIYAQREWRTQIQLYRRALEVNGINSDQFRNTRAIPIGVDIGKITLNPLRGNAEGNVIETLKSVKIGNADSSKIAPEDSFLLPVSTETEKTGNTKINEAIEKLWGIYDRIEKSTYSDQEWNKKKVEQQKLLSTIKELQIKGEVSSLRTLFNDSFKRFDKLKDYDLSYLDKEIEFSGQGALSEEREQEIESHVRDVNSALEFLSVFDSKFSSKLINSIEGLDAIDKQALNVLTGNSSVIQDKLESHLQEMFEKLGKLYNIDNINAYDFKQGLLSSFFMQFLPGSHSQQLTVKGAYGFNREVKLQIDREQDKLFNKKTGRFAVALDGLHKWASDNNISVWKAYEKLQDRDAQGKPVLKLLSKLKREYFDQIDPNKKDSKRVEFEQKYNEITDKLKLKGLRGDALADEVKKQYTEHISDWLKENYKVEDYKKEYKIQLEKYAKEIDEMVVDEDPLRNDDKKSQWINDWIEQHDIFSSPKALSGRNWILAKFLNEEKWHTDEYKNLLKPENKALLDTFNLFQDLNKRAKVSGMMDDISAYWKFIPHISVDGLTKLGRRITELPENVAEIIKHPRDIPSSLKKWIIGKAAGFIDAVNFTGASADYTDPLTGLPLRTRPIHYKRIKEGEENNQSKDLFSLYEQWGKHILHYDIVSQYENRFKALQILEGLKDHTLESANTTIRNNKGRLQDFTGSIKKAVVSSNKETLERLITKYLYDTSYDDYSPLQKVIDNMITYTRHLYLSFNIGPQLANLTDAYTSGLFSLGKWGDSKELAKGYLVATGITEGDISKYAPEPVRKTAFLAKELNLKIESEYMNKTHFEVSNLKKFEEKASIGMKLYGWGDSKAQEALAHSFFLNTTIKDGKLININDFVKAKYPDFFKKPIEEQSKLRTKIENEINEMKEKENLFSFVKKDGDGFKLDGIDLNSNLGKQQMRQYQAKFQRMVGEMIGNPDKFDPSYVDTVNIAKIVMQFKRWMPTLYGTRTLGYRYDPLSDEHLWGRNNLYTSLLANASLGYGASMKSIFTPLLFTVKSLTGAPLVSKVPFLKEGTSNLTYTNPHLSTDLQDVAKYMYQRKRLEFIRDKKPFLQTQDQFVDMYLTTLKGQMKELQTIALLIGAQYALGALYQKSDERRWLYNRLASWFQNTNLQARFLVDPTQQIDMVDRLIPMLSVLKDGVLLAESMAKYPFQDEETQDKAHIADKTLKMIPTVKQLHTWGKEIDPEYADAFGVRQPGAKDLSK